MQIVQASIAAMLIAAVSLGALDQILGTSWFSRAANRVYDAMLVPVARIGSASGHVSYSHKARHAK